MANILVVGSMNMDLTIETERIPKIGETITGKGFKTLPGGKGLNQAIACARLGGNVKFLGAVGDDAYGSQLIETLQSENIVYEGNVLENTSSGIAVITVCNGDNCIVLDSGANSNVSLDMLDEKKSLFEWAEYVIFQLEIPLETVVRGAELAKQCGAKVVLNPAPAKELPNELYQYVDIIVPNESETEILTGISLMDNESCEQAVLTFKNKGVNQVVITLGEKGCVFNSNDKIIFENAIKTEVVDTTAAGDSFIGAICVALGSGKTINEAVRFATKVSSISVSRRGASCSIPYFEEI